MGLRQHNLIELLKLHSPKVNNEVIPKPTLKQYKVSPFHKELLLIYKSFGGNQIEFPFNIGSYDCTLNGNIVELDEENHFTRYRAKTLKASIYNIENILDVAAYTKYCYTNESSCQARGGYWSNPSSDKQFGKSDSPNCFQTNGSSRWKQRAFYDLLKDHIPNLLNICVRRISIYEELQFEGSTITVHKILKSGDRKYSSIIYKRLN